MTSPIKLRINGIYREVSVSEDTPLLWVLRDHFGLTGTKYGCGISVCGCCMIHLDGDPVLSCEISAIEARGRDIITIEGLSGVAWQFLRHAFLKEQVPQCGYCQPAQIMTAAALLRKNPHPSEADIEDAMSNVLCRCGTYQRVKNAIQLAISMMNDGVKIG